MIQNPDATQAIRDQAKLTLAEGYPQVLNPNCQAVMDMTPRNHRNLNISRSTNTATSVTVYSVSSDKFFYLCSLDYGVVKDVTSDVATGRISMTATIDGVSQVIATIPILTLTAQQIIISKSFNPPLRVDKGGIITIANAASTAGTINKSATITGYEA